MTRRRLRSDATLDDCRIPYKYYDCHVYSKVSFFWLNSLLYKGCKEPLEQEDLGDIHTEERSVKHYKEFKNTYKQQVYLHFCITIVKLLYLLNRYICL